MTEKKDKTQDQAAQQAKSLNMQILAQYVRDISFENPQAPQSLRADSNIPKTDISFGLDTRKIEDKNIEDLFEVVLKVTATAKREDKTVFVCEVEYATLVSVANIPDDKKHPMLFIEVPRLSFPFVRRLIADLTQEGGFPPLLLNPVDFTALYMQRMQEEAEKNSGGKSKKKTS